MKTSKMMAANMPFIVGSVVIGAVCLRMKSALPLWALCLLPTFSYNENN